MMEIENPNLLIVYRRFKDDSIADEPADPFERVGLKAEDLSILTRSQLSKSGNFKASLVTPIVTTRPPDNWKNLPVIAIGQHHRYGNGWTNLLNKVVAVYNSYCTYAYKRNYIKKINSGKKNFPYFKGTAVCSRGECNCQLTAEIDTETSDFLRITFSGDICHKQGETSARKIRGEERNLIKSVFAGRSHTPGDLFRKKVASLSGDEFASGNRQGIGRKAKAFRHISAEAKRDQRLPSLLAKNLTELDEKLKKDDIQKMLQISN